VFNQIDDDDDDDDDDDEFLEVIKDVQFDKNRLDKLLYYADYILLITLGSFISCQLTLTRLYIPLSTVCVNKHEIIVILSKLVADKIKFHLSTNQW
jgi:hypothetical protein